MRSCDNVIDDAVLPVPYRGRAARSRCWWARHLSRDVMIDAMIPALAGALCFAAGAALQQREAVGATAERVASPRLLWQLAHRPVWLAGIGGAGLGVALHLFALTQGSLILVQPLGVTALVFAVPLAAALRGHRIRMWELGAAALVITGLVAVLGAIPTGPGSPRVGSDGTVGLLLSAGTLAAVLAAASGVAAVRWRSPLLASGAGIALGATSTFVRLLMRVGGQADETAPVVLACAGIAVLAPLGFLLTQHAYRAGGLPVALATITVLDPLTAAVGGVSLLHEPFPSAPLPTAVVAAGAVLAAVGIAVLARSPAHAAASGAASSQAVAHVGADRAERVDGPMRILLGADTYPPDVNGAAHFTYCLATGLAQRGHEVHLVCPSAHGGPTSMVVEGVTVHRLRSVRTPFHPTFRVCLPLLVGAAVRQVLCQVQPDVVHVQGHFLIGRALVRAARRLQVKLVATNHFMPDNLVTYAHIPHAARRVICDLGWRDFARVFEQADLVTTPTPTAADLIRGKGLRRPIQPISCGIDLQRFHPRAAGGHQSARYGLPDRPTLLFVGRLDEEKHLHELVAALPGVLHGTDAQLALAGKGTQRHRLEALARRLGVASHVHFLGLVPDDALPFVYQAADVFCMPGVAELQSLVTLEAMATGLPVIAADAMALPHLVHPDVNGHLYRPGDIATLATHAAALLTSPATRRRMGRASRELASTHDHACTLTRFEELYASLLDANRRAVSASI